MNKTNIKKPILCMIAIAIVGLMITSAFGSPVNSNGLSSGYKVKINKMNVTPQFLKTNTQTKTMFKNTVLPTSRASNLAFTGTHPTLGREASGTIVAAYYEGTTLQNIVWTFSTDDGATFDPGVYFNNPGGDYPSIKYWGPDAFFGTFVTNYQDANGGPTYLFGTTNPTDPTNSYTLLYWDWSTYGWHDMIDAAIGCDNSQNAWQWGVSSYITSSTYTTPAMVNTPTIVYADPVSSTQGWISWLVDQNQHALNGAAHTSCDIDTITHTAYMVYDWKDTTSGLYDIIIWQADFTDMQNGTNLVYTYSSATANLIKPSVAAYNHQVVVTAETDESGNQDIICLYSNIGDISNMQTSYVTQTGSNEQNPDVRSDGNGNFITTYTDSNNLLALISKDSGATWIDYSRKQINDNAGAVVEEYKCSYLSDNAVKAMWEEGTDIWIGTVAPPPNSPPLSPTITGPTKFKPNQEKTFTFTTTDPDGDSVYYFVDWGDNSTLNWQGPYSSGTAFTATHSWTTKAAFTIKCKAKDVNGLEGNYGSLKISTPRNSGLMLRFLDYIQHIFPNLWEKLGL